MSWRCSSGGGVWGVSRYSTNVSNHFQAPRFGNLSHPDICYPDHTFLDLGPTPSEGNVSQGVAVCGGIVYVSDSNSSTLRSFDAVSMNISSPPVKLDDAALLRV